MAEEKKSRVQELMIKLARLIVEKRKGFLVAFLVACVFCVTSISKVTVINDLTEYLPETTQTRQGLDIMDKEFTTLGSGKILLTNVAYEEALRLSKELESINGISHVQFYDMEERDDDYKDEELTDYYKDASALLTLTFEEPEDTEKSQAAIKEVRQALDGYEAYVYTTVDKDDAAELEEDMKGILVIVVAVILAVLLFTSGTYMEILIFLIVFAVAALLNMGTNYWFGEISFVTNAVGTVLQLALAIDYAIILFHRFMEEHKTQDTEPALIAALSKAIPEVSSSSLTTVSGMVALMLMQFGIGPDMGRVLTKAIICSMISVFFLMPALIMMFSRAIERTVHKSFVPSIRLWGKVVIRFRHVGIAVFGVIVVMAVQYSSRCPYIYDSNSIQSETRNEYLASKDRITQTFPLTNPMAVIVPKGDYQKEAQIIQHLEDMEFVDQVQGMTNIQVDDGGNYVLVDKLNPREFSQVADVDLDLVQMLYRLYALDRKQYGGLMQSISDYKIPIIDMIDFIYEQKENGAITFDADQSEEIDRLYQDVCDARAQLEGEDYSRIVFTMTGAVEGEETFAEIDQVQHMVDQYYDRALVVGDATSNYDLSRSFQKDNVEISILTALFVGIILLFTFQSAGLPFLLVLTIQSSIWINFSVPELTGSTMFFLSYLVVSSIQMGATIDYAIVITSRYLDIRTRTADKKEAVIEALDGAFPTIVTSGTILVCAAFAVGKLTSHPVISSLGNTLGWGALISVILVMTVLPQILVICDSFIEKTRFSGGKAERRHFLSIKDKVKSEMQTAAKEAKNHENQ